MRTHKQEPDGHRHILMNTPEHGFGPVRTTLEAISPEDRQSWGQNGGGCQSCPQPGTSRVSSLGQAVRYFSRSWSRGQSRRAPQGLTQEKADPVAPGWYLNTWRILKTRRSMILSVSSREQLSRCSWSWLRLREVTRPCTGMIWVQRGPLRSRNKDG
jgi:hypothetical protein